MLLFKTNYTRLQNFSEICVNGKTFPLSNSVRFLGIYPDEVLSWRKHVAMLCERLGPVCYTFSVLQRYLSYEQLRMMYFTNFQSLLSFGIIFWGKSTDYKKVFVMQKRAIRIITHMSFRQSCRGVFREHNILTVIGLYIYETLVHFSKYKRNESSCYFDHLYPTRGINYKLPSHRLSLYENSPLYMSIKLFNKLPMNIKEIETAGSFKEQLYRYLVEAEPYDMEEYFAK